MRYRYEVLIEVDADEIDTTVMHEDNLQRKVDAAFSFAPMGAVLIISSRKVAEVEDGKVT